ncbi:MAG: thiol reductant ABC exporter subunit CydC [Cellulomonadaceae bacterium]|jgi:ATP-binding cassette subfamily C protein CydC|nr:thiol reductant ABC exporter subunit CydC [Cellulomonadaceae bacterium]
MKFTPATSPAIPVARPGQPGQQGDEAANPLRTVLNLLDISVWRVLRAVLLGALALGFSVGLAATSAWLIARASQMPPVLTLSVAVVGVRAFGVGRGLLRYGERLASHDVALRGMTALRANLYDALARGPVTGVVGLRRGDLLARMGADVDAVGDLVVRSLVPAGVALLVTAGSVTLMWVLLPAAGAALLACLLVAGVLAPWLAARGSRLTEARCAAARSEVAARALTLLETGDQLRVAGRLDGDLRRLRDAERALVAAGDEGARASGLAAAIAAAAQTCAVVAALWLGWQAVEAGTLHDVNLAVIALTPLAVFEATSVLPAAAIQLHRSCQAATRLAALLPAVSTASVNTTQGIPATQHRDSDSLLSLDNVSAGWAGGSSVEHMSLDLRAGDVVAVVGASGVGKSTLLMTAAGLLPPLAGSVAGTAAGRAPSAGGPLFVAEDGHIFDTTVLENLRVARGNVTADEAVQALTAVGLSGWLAALPDGLDTMLGSDATTVSGGERRRLLIARALLSPASVLLVDEPAEHLDAQAADAVVAALAAHARASGEAVIYATHRLESTTIAARVVALH